MLHARVGLLEGIRHRGALSWEEKRREEENQEEKRGEEGGALGWAPLWGRRAAPPVSFRRS